MHLLEDVEAEGNTDDGWTLVQCRCKSRLGGCKCQSPDVGLSTETAGHHECHDNGVREQNRFTMLNESIKWEIDNGTTLKDHIHEHDRMRDRETTREATTIGPKRNG